jgi:hypothetical protein
MRRCDRLSADPLSPRRSAVSIVPVVCKSIVFGLLVVVFTILAPMTMGWIRGHGAIDGLREIAAVGAYETAARPS